MDIFEAVRRRDVDAVKAILAVTPKAALAHDEDGDTALLLAGRWQLWINSGPFPGEDVDDDADEDESFDEWAHRKHWEQNSKLMRICELLVDAGANTAPLRNWLNDDPMRIKDAADYGRLRSFNSGNGTPYDCFEDPLDILEDDMGTIEELQRLSEHSRSMRQGSETDSD